MKRFLLYMPSKFFSTHGNTKLPRRGWLRLLLSVGFFFLFSFSYSQTKSLSNFTPSLDRSSNLIAGKFQSQQPFYSQLKYFVDNNSNSESARFATCTSIASGVWSDPLIWSCGAPPTSTDNVVIAAGTTVTVDINT